MMLIFRIYLLPGAFFFKTSFTEDLKIIDILDKLISEKFLRYFNIITLKFCLTQSGNSNTELLKKLHDYLFDFLMSNQLDLQKSEHYMILCEYLGFKDVDKGRKNMVFIKIYGGQISTAVLSKLASRVGFVEWNNLNIEHLLKRKQLRPVYAIA